MRVSTTLLSVFAGLCVASSVHAAEHELVPLEGLSITLGNALGTAYYTVENDGYRVVATIASGEKATPFRFIATLVSGQRVSLSVPRAVGQSALTLDIERIADRMLVNDSDKISQ